ncbi:transposase [Thermostichus sp. OS-CIW-17]
MGRSRGGYSTKIHVSVDGLGNPLELRITGGEKSDITQGEELIEGWQRKDTKVIGDKGYDADKLIEKIGEAQAVIPPKRNRKTQRHYDKHLYKDRHLIECFFHKLKQYRHLFSRFDKLARNFLSFLYLVSALFWLK